MSYVSYTAGACLARVHTVREGSGLTGVTHSSGAILDVVDVAGAVAPGRLLLRAGTRLAGRLAREGVERVDRTRRALGVRTAAGGQHKSYAVSEQASTSAHCSASLSSFFVLH